MWVGVGVRFGRRILGKILGDWDGGLVVGYSGWSGVTGWVEGSGYG
jgi:hypothetical protein